MSVLSDGFYRALGEPENGGGPIAFVTDDVVASIQWESALRELRGGRYLDRFAWILTPHLEALHRCLRAWAFLVPESSDRVILGRNAYGAIAFADDVSAGRSRVSIVDPLTLRLLTSPSWDIIGFFGQALPEQQTGHFLDTSVYSKWLRTSRLYLEDDLALAIKLPLPLDGKLEPDNFQVENIFEYYETTAPSYSKAVAAMKPAR